MTRFFTALFSSIVFAAVASAAPVTIDYGPFGSSALDTGQTQEITFDLLVWDNGVSDSEDPLFRIGGTLFTPADNGDHTLVWTSLNTPDFDAAVALLTDNIASYFAIHMVGAWQIVDYGDGPELVNFVDTYDLRIEGLSSSGFIDLPDTINSITVNITGLFVGVTHVFFPPFVDDYFNGASMQNVSVTFSEEIPAGPAIPEPASVTLLTVGALAMLRRRSR